MVKFYRFMLLLMSTFSQNFLWKAITTKNEDQITAEEIKISQ